MSVLAYRFCKLEHAHSRRFTVTERQLENTRRRTNHRERENGRTPDGARPTEPRRFYTTSHCSTSKAEPTRPRGTSLTLQTVARVQVSRHGARGMGMVTADSARAARAPAGSASAPAGPRCAIGRQDRTRQTEGSATDKHVSLSNVCRRRESRSTHVCTAADRPPRSVR